MDKAVTQIIGESDWNESFSRLSPDRRKKMLDRAVRLLADAAANPNERDLSICQLQAALMIDPVLVFNVITAAYGNQTSSDDVERLKREAADAQSNFNGLVKATETLRASLTKIGIIGKKDRLPETKQQWRKAIENVVKWKARELTAKEDHLLQLQQQMEKRRAEIIAEIEAAEKKYEEKIPLLSKLSFGMFGSLKSRIADVSGAISSASFDLEHIQAPEPGQLVPGEGIFMRLWTPKYKNGEPMGIECELYAAPEDLRYVAPNSNGGLLTYLDTIKRVANLRNWHGHDGGSFANDEAVVTFLDRSAKEFVRTNGDGVAGQWFRPHGIGKWFIPPRELLCSKDSSGNKIQAENLYDCKDKGAFAGTFTTESGSASAGWYWSSTENRDHPDYVYNVIFSDGNDDWHHKDNNRLSCRPCRVGRVRHLTI